MANDSWIRQNPKKTLFLILFILAFILLIFAEMFTRTLAPQFLPKDFRDIYSDDNFLGWTYDKGKTLEKVNPWGEKRILLRFNEEGFRNKNLDEMHPEKTKIMFIGDSGTAAIQVDEDKRFSSLVEQGLGPQFEAVNFGVNGYGADQAAMTIDQYGEAVRPKTIVYLFTENDLEETGKRIQMIWPYSYGRPTYDEHFNYQPKPFTKRRVGKAVVYHEAIVWMKENFAFMNLLITSTKGLIQKVKGGKKSTVNEFEGFSRDEVTLIKRVPISSIVADEKQAARWNTIEKMIQYMDRKAKSLNAKLVVLPFVNYMQVNDEIKSTLVRYYTKKGITLDFQSSVTKLKEICDKNGIENIEIDINEATEYQKQHGSIHFVRGITIFDGHKTEVGHKFYGEKILNHLKNENRLL